MKRRSTRLLLAATILWLSLYSFGQGHSFPATDSNSVWTGTNNFTNTFTLSSLADGCLHTASGIVLSTGSPCPSAPPVTSVFGRTGAITAQSGDYTVGQVTGAVSGATSNGGLTLTGSTLGLLTSCSDTQVLQWSAGGSSWGCATISASGVTGSGTTSTIPLWTSSTALGNSTLTQNSGSVQLANGTSLASLNISDGAITVLDQPNDSTRVCASPCVGGKLGLNYSDAAGLGSNGPIGAYVPVNVTGGTSTTSVFGGLISVIVGNGNNTGAVTNQYGMQIRSNYNGGSSGMTVGTNTWLNINYANQPGVSSLKVTNDYGIFIDAVPLNPYTNHSAIYIADQAAHGQANTTWYAINIQPQSISPGFNVPTVVINMGGVVHYSGSGVPSFTPVSYPAIFWRTDGGTASTVEYICVATNAWTAVTVP